MMTTMTTHICRVMEMAKLGLTAVTIWMMRRRPSLRASYDSSLVSYWLRRLRKPAGAAAACLNCWIRITCVPGRFFLCSLSPARPAVFGCRRLENCRWFRADILFFFCWGYRKHLTFVLDIRGRELITIVCTQRLP